MVAVLVEIYEYILEYVRLADFAGGGCAICSPAR